MADLLCRSIDATKTISNRTNKNAKCRKRGNDSNSRRFTCASGNTTRLDSRPNTNQLARTHWHTCAHTHSQSQAILHFFSSTKPVTIAFTYVQVLNPNHSILGSDNGWTNFYLITRVLLFLFFKNQRKKRNLVKTINSRRVKPRRQKEAIQIKSIQSENSSTNSFVQINKGRKILSRVPLHATGAVYVSSLLLRINTISQSK